MSVKEMGYDFQAYNLCKAISPQKGSLLPLKNVIDNLICKAEIETQT